MAQARPVPEGYPRVTPYLHVHDGDAAIAFYRDVFGATERMRLPGPAGTIGHAELEFGESVVMVSDEYLDMDIRSPRSIGGTPVTIHVYVEDVDRVFARALQAGAQPLRAVADQFYGDRTGQFVDPFGHRWNVASHVRDVSPEEIARQAAAMSGEG